MAQPIPQLQMISPAGPEHEYRAGERILVRFVLYQSTEPIMPLANVNRRGGHHDPHLVGRDDQMKAVNAQMIYAIRTARQAASSRSVTSPRITSKAVAIGGSSATGS